MKISKRMKRNIGISALACLVTLLIGGGLSLFTKSDDFYPCAITSWNIDAKLKDNGDLHIIDTIKFKSDGYTFFEYEIGYGKNIIHGTGKDSYFDYDSIKVSVYNEENKYYFSNRSTSTDNATSYYKTADCLGFSWNSRDCENEGYLLSNYTKNQKKELVYVYLHDGLDSTINFKYEYVIKNAANKYYDVTELNWQFATPLEDMKVENISLNLTLPEGCINYSPSYSWDENGILAFGHGNGSSEITNFTSNNIQTFTEKLNRKIGDVLDLRVVIPNSPNDCFSNLPSENRIATNGGRELRIEEENLTKLDLMNTKIYNDSRNSFIVINILTLVASIASIFITYYLFDKERKADFDAEYLREPPSKIIPSELSYLINEKEITTEAFTANMISLIKKKYLLIDSNGSLLTDEKANYRISKNDDVSLNEKLNDDEEFIYNLLFNKLFKTGTFTMEEFEEKMKIEKNALVYSNSIQQWQKASYEKGERLKYYDNINNARIFSLVGIGLIFLSIYAINELYLFYFLPTLLIIFSAINIAIATFALLYASNITRKSKKGIEEYTKWNAFKKFLCDFSHFEDYDIMSVIMWEEYLIYANVLGVADLVEKQMRIKLKELPEEQSINEYNHYNDFYFYLHMNRINRRMVTYSYIANRTIAQEKARRAASSAGKIASSGGFGGSSSFGGGGHGGRAG